MKRYDIQMEANNNFMLELTHQEDNMGGWCKWEDVENVVNNLKLQLAWAEELNTNNYNGRIKADKALNDILAHIHLPCEQRDDGIIEQIASNGLEV